MHLRSVANMNMLGLSEAVLEVLLFDLPPDDLIRLLGTCQRLSNVGSGVRGLAYFARTRLHLGPHRLTVGRWMQVWHACSSYARSQGWEPVVWVHACFEVSGILEVLSSVWRDELDNDSFLCDCTEIEPKSIIALLNLFLDAKARTGDILDSDIMDSLAVNDERVA